VNEMEKKLFVITGITFAVFMTEALIHYNYGILETVKGNFTWNTFVKEFKIPKGKSFIKMASIVAVASFISGELITIAERTYK
tara:strand:+ start:3018 stop:3266 length:249 start_codon:yes stop_codon:yes gene_type:complete